MSKPPEKDRYQWNEAGYFGVRHKLYKDGFAKKLGVTNMAVYYCILAHTDRKTGYAELSLTDFSNLIDILDRHVLVRCIKTLEDFSFIATRKQQGKTTQFYPLHHALWLTDKPYQRREQRSDKGKPRKKRQKSMNEYTQHLQALSEQERYNVLQQQRRQMLSES